MSIIAFDAITYIIHPMQNNMYNTKVEMSVFRNCLSCVAILVLKELACACNRSWSYSYTHWFSRLFCNYFY